MLQVYVLPEWVTDPWREWTVDSDKKAKHTNDKTPEFEDRILRYDVSYEELLTRLEDLELIMTRLADDTEAEIANGIFNGAQELIYRHDETGDDFTIAIVALFNSLSSQINQK